MNDLKETTLKHTITAVSCAAALVASLAACGSGDDKSALPSNNGGSIPSTTATSRPTTTPPTATAATGSGPVALAAHSTYAYGGLKVRVNLPADIPTASRPSMRLFSEFLQARGRTTARNKLDPALPRLASADVVKYLEGTNVAESVQGIGSVILTISKIQTVAGHTTVVTGCLDQSKLVQVRKDGSHFVAGAKTKPTLKMTANINRRMTGSQVTLYTFAAGPC
jgi:hypothetical protein